MQWSLSRFWYYAFKTKAWWSNSVSTVIKVEEVIVITTLSSLFMCEMDHWFTSLEHGVFHVALSVISDFANSSLYNKYLYICRLWDITPNFIVSCKLKMKFGWNNLIIVQTLLCNHIVVGCYGDLFKLDFEWHAWIIHACRTSVCLVNNIRFCRFSYFLINWFLMSWPWECACSK